jgi:hypothetical protein
MTKWNSSYTSVTSATITNSQHGIGSQMIGVVCIPTGGTALTLSQVSWTINASTYAVDISFNSSFTGTVYLSGPWPSSDTSNSTDFQVAIGSSNSSNLWVCELCGTWTARRTVSGFSPVAANAGMALQWLDTSVSQTVYVYLDGNQIMFGLSESTCGGSQWTGGDAYADAIACGVTSMPPSVIELGTATMVNGVFTSVTDNRPW